MRDLWNIILSLSDLLDSISIHIIYLLYLPSYRITFYCISFLFCGMIDKYNVSFSWVLVDNQIKVTNKTIFRIFTSSFRHSLGISCIQKSNKEYKSVSLRWSILSSQGTYTTVDYDKVSWASAGLKVLLGTVLVSCQNTWFLAVSAFRKYLNS